MKNNQLIMNEDEFCTGTSNRQCCCCCCFLDALLTFALFLFLFPSFSISTVCFWLNETIKIRFWFFTFFTLIFSSSNTRCFKLYLQKQISCIYRPQNEELHTEQRPTPGCCCSKTKTVNLLKLCLSPYCVCVCLCVDDHSRVLLSLLTADSDSDYINANLIKVTTVHVFIWNNCGLNVLYSCRDQAEHLTWRRDIEQPIFTIREKRTNHILSHSCVEPSAWGSVKNKVIT